MPSRRHKLSSRACSVIKNSCGEKMAEKAVCTEESRTASPQDQQGAGKMTDSETDKEQQTLCRKMKEQIFIRQHSHPVSKVKQSKMPRYRAATQSPQ